MSEKIYGDTRITHIVIHCSDSVIGDAAMIDLWHKARGWRGIGYHYVIKTDGIIEKGRALNDDDWISGNEVGAHCLGLNDRSIGICLIGKAAFTKRQLAALQFIVVDLMERHAGIAVDNVVGHCETASGKAERKTCPNFSVAKLRGMLAAQQSAAEVIAEKDFNFR